MPDDPIIIADYDPDWPAQFRARGAAMRAALGAVALRIDHIGSTSIPGLAAKPVIDIQIAVADRDALEAFRGPLESLGYAWRSDNPEKTKRYFREGPGMPRTHIHVRELGSYHQQWPLLFRDFVRIDAPSRAEYEAEKRRLAARFGADRDGYTDAKDDIFGKIIYRADRWAAETGWRPGASDA
jgi:GrpB-like predicted nucleotidyltransferase (UPF0157 family)